MFEKLKQFWLKRTKKTKIALIVYVSLLILGPIIAFFTAKNLRIAELFPNTPPVTPPAQVNRVFITSVSYNGNLGGLSGADTKCQERANVAGLGGSWKAWLSDDTVATRERLIHSSSQYIRLDGETIANNWSDLTDGAIQNAINITENNTVLNSDWVWTNSFADGSIRQSSEASCYNWSSTSSGGATGDSSRTDSGWSDFGASACYYNRPLYCFEQNIESSPSPSPLPNTKPAFWTTQLPVAIMDLNYSATVTAYDNDTNDPLSITISNLPAGLNPQPCQLFTSLIKKQKMIFCPISGEATASGTAKVAITLTDGKQTVSKTLSLTVVQVIP